MKLLPTSILSLLFTLSFCFAVPIYQKMSKSSTIISELTKDNIVNFIEIKQTGNWHYIGDPDKDILGWAALQESNKNDAFLIAKLKKEHLELH